MASQHTQHQEAPKEDQARYDCEQPGIQALPCQIAVKGNRQEPELDAYEQNAERKACKDHSDPAGWRPAFDITCGLTEEETITIHCGISSTAYTVLPS